MDLILNSIIGIVCAVVGAVLAAVVKFWLEHRQSIFRSLTTNRRKAISGHWAGRVYQAEGPKAGVPIEFDIDFHLSTRNKKIQGNAYFVWRGAPIELEISGGYITDDYLKLEYKDSDYKVLRYGTIFFRMHPDGKNLSGRFLGYAPEPQGLIYGKVDPSKKSGGLESRG
jgi:hypothetical protein